MSATTAIPLAILCVAAPLGVITRCDSERRGPAPMPILGPLGNLLKFARDPIGYAGRLFGAYDRFHSYALSGRYFPEGSTAPRMEPQKRLFTGLFHVNGDEHRRHRQLLMPSFHKHRIDAYRNDTAHAVGKMLETYIRVIP